MINQNDTIEPDYEEFVHLPTGNQCQNADVVITVKSAVDNFGRSPSIDKKKTYHIILQKTVKQFVTRGVVQQVLI